MEVENTDLQNEFSLVSLVSKMVIFHFPWFVGDTFHHIAPKNMAKNKWVTEVITLHL